MLTKVVGVRTCTFSSGKTIPELLERLNILPVLGLEEEPVLGLGLAGQNTLNQSQCFQAKIPREIVIINIINPIKIRIAIFIIILQF
jgi:hypothetical protein